MSVEAAFWLFFMLPLALVIIGGYAITALRSFADEYQHLRQRVRMLHSENHQLRDENARLRERQAR